MRKAETHQARILTVEDAMVVNPMGTPLSGVQRSGAPTNLGSTFERFRVTFLLEGDVKWSTVVSAHNAGFYIPGTRGELKHTENEIIRWIPESEGAEGGKKAVKTYDRNRRKKIILAVALAIVLIACAAGLVIFLNNRSGEDFGAMFTAEERQSVHMTLSTKKDWVVRWEGGGVKVVDGEESYLIRYPSYSEFSDLEESLNDPEKGYEKEQTWNRNDMQMQVVKGPDGNKTGIVSAPATGTQLLIECEGKNQKPWKIFSKISLD